MQFEAVKPAQYAFPALDKVFKHLIPVNAFGVYNNETKKQHLL